LTNFWFIIFQDPKRFLQGMPLFWLWRLGSTSTDVSLVQANCCWKKGRLPLTKRFQRSAWREQLPASKQKLPAQRGAIHIFYNFVRLGAKGNTYMLSPNTYMLDREADPRLGRNISTRDAESLHTASRSIFSYCPRSGFASGSLKWPRSGALPT
jgi:hypothetical protein